MQDVNENFMNKKRDSKFSCFVLITACIIIIAFFVYIEKSTKKQDIEENTNNNEIKQEEVIKTQKSNNDIIDNLLNKEYPDDLDAGIREKEVYILCLDEIITNSSSKAISKACVKVFEQQKIKEENNLKELKEIKKYIDESIKDLFTDNNNNKKEKVYSF